MSISFEVKFPTNQPITADQEDAIAMAIHDAIKAELDKSDSGLSILPRKHVIVQRLLPS